MKIISVFAASAVIGLSAQTEAGLANFLMTNGSGTLYEIDGNTLEANWIGQLQNAQLINEIQYIGNGEILANMTGGMQRYNLNTGVQSIEYINANEFDTGFFHQSQGAALTSNGDIYFAVQSQINGMPSTYGVLYDPTSGDLTEMAEHSGAPGGLYFDFHEVGQDVYAAVEQTGQSIRIIDAITGENQALYDTGINNSSFISLDGSLFVVTLEGDMYNFDVSDGSLDFYGSITGFSSNLLGVTNIPSPATLMAFVFASGLACRRQR